MSPVASVSQPPRASYLPYIDGLRAIAILAVFVYHLRDSWLPGGFAGVDIFFVISGFVVSASVANWRQGGFRDLSGYFYARRMQRIAPALVACLLVTSLASTLFIPRAWLSSNNDLTGLFAFVGLSNFHLAANRQDYFSPSTDFNPYTHTWSLGVEEQFYLLFPLLFLAWTRGGRWRDLSLALFGLALVASLGVAWLHSHSDPGAAFYLITTRFWQLAAGVLLHLGMMKLQTRSEVPGRWPGLAKTGAWLSLVLLGCSLWISAPGEFPFPGGWMPVVATLGLLGFLYRHHAQSVLGRTLGHPAVTAIGKRSYSLYLWHWPVLVVLRWTSGVDSTATMIAAVVLTVLLAELSFRYVEAPLRYAANLRKWSRPRVLWTGATAIAACAVLSLALILARPWLSLSTVSRNTLDWYPQALKSLDELPGCMLRKNKTNEGVRAWTYSRTGCAEPAQPSPRIFALGDSHSLAYVTLLSEYALRTGADVVIYPNPECSYANLRTPSPSPACEAQSDAILADIARRAGRGDILFLAALRLNRFSNQDGMLDSTAVVDSLKGDTAAAIRQAAQVRLALDLAPLSRLGMRIVFEAPKPIFPSPPFRCSDAFNSDNPACRAGLTYERQALLDYRAPVLSSLDQLAAQLNGSVWDPFPLLCPQPVCTAALDGRPLFFDGDHISGHANRLLYPSFADFLARLRR